MCRSICVFRKESELVELSVDVQYEIMNMEDREILVINNLNKTKWYPSHYFRII